MALQAYLYTWTFALVWFADAITLNPFPFPSGFYSLAWCRSIPFQRSSFFNSSLLLNSHTTYSLHSTYSLHPLHSLAIASFRFIRSPSEEFFRLKKIQGKKKRDAEAAEQERLARLKDKPKKNKKKEDGNEDEDQDQDQEEEGNSGDSGLTNGAEGGKDMLDQGKDEDVIF